MIARRPLALTEEQFAVLRRTTEREVLAPSQFYRFLGAATVEAESAPKRIAIIHQSHGTRLEIWARFRREQRQSLRRWARRGRVIRVPRLRVC